MRWSRYFYGGGGGPTESAFVLLYDTLISGFLWMLAVYEKIQRF